MALILFASTTSNIMDLPITQYGDDVLIRIKAVPGASRDEIAGILGNRLKIRIAAAPEAGKANKAIIKLIAEKCGVKVNQITIESGHTSPEKTLRITDAHADLIINSLK